MEDVAAGLSQRRAKVTRMEALRIQAEQTLETAQAGVTETERLMYDEFGVTPDRVPAMKDQLERQIRDEEAMVDRALAEAGL